MQLKRLAEQGYVRSANLRGRSAYYTLSEPLYAIWHQMRFGRNARQKMQWLVNFLKIWYDATELGAESKRLKARFHACLRSDQIRNARQILEQRFYVAEAMSEPACNHEMNSILADFLEINDKEVTKIDVLAAALSNFKDERLPKQLVHKSKVCIEQEDVSALMAPHVRLQRAFALIGEEQYQQAREELDCAIMLASSPSSLSAPLKMIYLCRLFVDADLDDTQEMAYDWQRFLTIKGEGDDWHTTATQVLLHVALNGKIQFARELIASSGMEHIFLPLTYALDTVLTGKRTELEKLSPEVRIIAAEIVERLCAA